MHALRCLTSYSPGLEALLSDGCPATAWDAVAAELMASSHPKPVLVNVRFHEPHGASGRLLDAENLACQVGANKGYNVAEFLAQWTQRGVTNQRWHRSIQEVAAQNHSQTLKDRHMSCGICGACRRPPVDAHGRTGGTAGVSRGRERG